MPLLALEPGMGALVADRFVAAAGAWLDLATGAAVRLRILPAGSDGDQIAWNARCSRLACLRHPLINPLVDFGAVDATRVFEAYEHAGPYASTGQIARRLVTHLGRFLASHDACVPPPIARLLVRPVIAGRASTRIPIGVVLQPRAAYTAALDALDLVGPAGTSVIRIQGRALSGLRTLQRLVARAARLSGYVPVATSVVRRHPWIAGCLSGRHVCVLDEAGHGDEAAVAGFVVGLCTQAARRHVMFRFIRSDRSGHARTVCLDKMGATAMIGMVHVDSESGVTPQDLLRAALAADGLPGVFLQRLGGGEFGPLPNRASVVHESPHPYIARPLGPPRPSRDAPIGVVRRTAAVALRAAGRAETLARQGRHPAAARALVRALTVLRARGERRAATESAMSLGWLALDRARIEDAVSAFQAAGEAGADADSQVAAAIGRGVAWTDAGRLAEAEAVLRSASVAAEGLGDPAPALDAIAALGRCLCWMGRFDEALAILREAAERPGPVVSRSRLAEVTARVHLAESDLSSAVRTARRAVALAAEAQDPRSRASATRTLAQAILTAGDPDGARCHLREALTEARRAHLPLASIRLRLVLLASLPASSRESRRLSDQLESVAGRLPPLLGSAVRTAVAGQAGREPDAETRRFLRTAGVRFGMVNPVADLEGLLELAHKAPDDRRAIETICETLQRRLRAGSVLVVGAPPERRTFVCMGRPWPGDPAVAWRAMASGAHVAPDPRTEPCEAAEPLRYGGEIVAAVGCRWVAGTVIDPTRVLTLLHLGGLALAPHVRACLDRDAPVPEYHHDLELLGESPPARALRDAIWRAARAPFPVLIEGESGSGKELVARGIHRLGPRRERRLSALNCAALSDDLIEAELFGHVRGAFTGAIGDRSGLFEEADGGTLFLDEIGELSARAQAKLLRVLQDGEVRRVGDTIARRVDVRIVAATNRQLRQEAAEGRFRSDLRFRLDVVRIDVPPLRERASDIPMLASHFWSEAARRVGSQATLTPEALSALARYDWPGNVRELQNAIAWMAVHSPRRGRIGPAALPAQVARAGSASVATFESARLEFERRYVRAALATADGHRGRAAKSLGMTRQGLAKMLTRLGIE